MLNKFNNRSNRSLIPHNEVIKRYLKNESSLKISKIAGISYTGVIGILKRNGIKRRKGTKKYDYKIITKDYEDGMFIVDIAKKYNTDSSNIIRILKYENIKLRGKRKGFEHPFWKGGKTYDKDGYIIQKEGRTHRIVFENNIGRKLKHWEDIHHINGDKKDFNIDNLVLMPSREHIRFHIFLRQLNYKINKENLEKFCRKESKFIWRITRDDLIKICNEQNIKLVSINKRKKIKKRCRIKKCDIINYTTKSFCSKHYQRYVAKKRGYWLSSRGRKSLFYGKYQREKNKIENRP